jgi:hypothetical protein
MIEEMIAKYIKRLSKRKWKISVPTGQYNKIESNFIAKLTFNTPFTNFQIFLVCAKLNIKYRFKGVGK